MRAEVALGFKRRPNLLVWRDKRHTRMMMLLVALMSRQNRTRVGPRCDFGATGHEGGVASRFAAAIGGNGALR